MKCLLHALLKIILLRTKFFLAIFLFAGSTHAVVQTRIFIKVGAYDFPPYYSSTAQNASDAGLLYLALHRLNNLQKKYFFEIVPTSPNRKFMMFNSGKFDLLFFEDPDWGWSDRNFSFVPLAIRDGEIYITNKTNPHLTIRHLKQKKLTLAGVQGFHYQLGESKKSIFPFAEHHIAVYGHESVLRMVAGSRASMGLVPKSYYFAQTKVLQTVTNQLSPSREIDTEYRLGIIRRKKSPISYDEVHNLSILLMSDPEFKKVIQELQIIKKTAD